MENSNLKTLLDRYFSGKITVSTEKKRKALNVWKEPVTSILKRVQMKDPRFSLSPPIYSGSYYERAKVKEPNEFDLMLEMENLHLGRSDQYDSHEDNLSTDLPHGYTTVMIDQGEEVQWKRDRCIPRNGNLLSAMNVKAVFARYVHEAIRELEYSNFIQAVSSGPAVTLQVTDYSDVYSIDLTLAIKDESWPDDADEWKTRQRRGWPARHLVDEIVQTGCHLVAKRPREVTTPESEFFWRYSFSAVEKKLALKGGSGEPGTCSKKILRILKSLREEYQMTPLTSYHLKTIMFYEREENPNASLWTEELLATRFQNALARLLRCLKNRRCPHYFIKDVNIFDTRFEHRYDFLIRLVADIQRDPQKYLTLP